VTGIADGVDPLVTPDCAAGSDVALCLYAGTLIRTPLGDKPVETLTVGALVHTWSGDTRPIADLTAYHPVWFLRRNSGSAGAPLDGFPRLLTWAARIAAIGHGSQSQMSAQQALDVARDATSIVSATVDPRDPVGRKPRQTVTVTPDDTGRDRCR
jgi:Hint domain